MSSNTYSLNKHSLAINDELDAPKINSDHMNDRLEAMGPEVYNGNFNFYDAVIDLVVGDDLGQRRVHGLITDSASSYDVDLDRQEAVGLMAEPGGETCTIYRIVKDDPRLEYAVPDDRHYTLDVYIEDGAELDSINHEDALDEVRERLNSVEGHPNMIMSSRRNAIDRAKEYASPHIQSLRDAAHAFVER